ncbi:MAG TPA: ImmA/IrrE family metallo-endopeptidase [Actinomycetota bacterium]|nr:ImmA/IrrE family metallo-endopeptidase [Actinomycetota bacterium]
MLADLHGIAVYRAPLGQDLRETVSGAFLRHATVGAAILINGETTPGRQQFTLAHELAHALFHTESWYVGFFGRRERDERFADEFASEFLVPVQSLRGVVETIGLPKVEDPAVVVYLQRLFRVSWAMMLVRLQAANLVSSAGLE